MSNSDEFHSNLRVGLAIETGMAIAAQKQATILDQQAEIAKLRAEQRTVTRRSDGEYEAMLAQRQVEVLRAELILKDDALRERDALILDWMHSNEAFKRLAREYGSKINVSDAQRKNDFAKAVVDIAEEDSRFANSGMAIAKRKQLNINK